NSTWNELSNECNFNDEIINKADEDNACFHNIPGWRPKYKHYTTWAEAYEKGKACQIMQQTCSAKNKCSGHGTCTKGNCTCDKGWKGEKCDEVAKTCLNNCSGHGQCSDEYGTCDCDIGW